MIKKKKSLLVNILLINSFLLGALAHSNYSSSTIDSTTTVTVKPGKIAFVIVMDGVARRFFTKENLPNVYEKLVPQGVMFSQAKGVSPAITTVNHIALITGAYPNATGAVATSTYNSTAYHLDGSKNRIGFGSSNSIPTETLLTHADDVLNLIIVGKSKLANLKKDVNFTKGSTFTVLPQEYHDITIKSQDNEEINVDVYDSRFDTNIRLQQNSWLINETMAQLLKNREQIKNGRDTFVFINLPSTDWAGHTFGVDPSPFHLNTSVYTDLLKDTDRQINRLLNFLHTNDLYDSSSFFLSADHGFHNVLPGSPRPILSTSTPTAFDIAMNSTFFSIENKSYQNLYVVANAENTLHLYLRWPEQTIKKAVEFLNTKAIAQDFIGHPTIWKRMWLRDEYKELVNDTSLYTGLLSNVGMNTETAGDIVLEYRPDASAFGGFKPQFASSLGDHGVTEDTPIPLVMAGAGFKHNITESSNASITDIIPTVARLLGIKGPAQSNGKVWDEYFTNEAAVSEVHLASSQFQEDSPLSASIEYATFGTGPYSVEYSILDKKYQSVFEDTKTGITGSGNISFTFTEGGKFENSPYYVVSQIKNPSGSVIDQAQDFIVITTAVAPEFPYVWLFTVGILAGVVGLTVTIGKKMKKNN